LFNLNFNHSFNQTLIFSNQPQLKVLFIKQLFSNLNHNTKHTLIIKQNIEFYQIKKIQQNTGEKNPKKDQNFLKKKTNKTGGETGNSKLN
jgi:hypothetical protein